MASEHVRPALTDATVAVHLLFTVSYEGSGALLHRRVTDTLFVVTEKCQCGFCGKCLETKSTVWISLWKTRGRLELQLWFFSSVRIISYSSRCEYCSAATRNK